MENELYPSSVEEARVIQERLYKRFKGGKIGNDIRLVAGADVSYFKEKKLAIGVVVVLDARTFDEVEVAVVEDEVHFPYIPGYLAFREVPVLIKSFDSLSSVDKIDMILVDGQGRAHPRGMGLATHLGILLDKPTIGVAKTRLVGEYEVPGEEKGEWSNLNFDGKCIGRVLRTRSRIKPLFISVGHRINIEDAVESVLRFCIKYKLPEPIRIADRLASIRRKEIKREWNYTLQ